MQCRSTLPRLATSTALLVAALLAGTACAQKCLPGTAPAKASSKPFALAICWTGEGIEIPDFLSYDGVGFGLITVAVAYKRASAPIVFKDASGRVAEGDMLIGGLLVRLNATDSPPPPPVNVTSDEYIRAVITWLTGKDAVIVSDNPNWPLRKTVGTSVISPSYFLSGVGNLPLFLRMLCSNEVYLALTYIQAQYCLYTTQWIDPKTAKVTLSAKFKAYCDQWRADLDAAVFSMPPRNFTLPPLTP